MKDIKHMDAQSDNQLWNNMCGPSEVAQMLHPRSVVHMCSK